MEFRRPSALVYAYLSGVGRSIPALAQLVRVAAIQNDSIRKNHEVLIEELE